jgi:hypothetical protein
MVDLRSKFKVKKSKKREESDRDSEELQDFPFGSARLQITAAARKDPFALARSLYRRALYLQ